MKRGGATNAQKMAARFAAHNGAARFAAPRIQRYRNTPFQTWALLPPEGRQSYLNTPFQTWEGRQSYLRLELDFCLPSGGGDAWDAGLVGLAGDALLPTDGSACA